MSYTYLQEAGAVSSAASFWDIPASVLLRSTPIVAVSYCNGNETESCHASQYGMTCGHSTETHGADGLTQSTPAFPAKESAQPAKVEVSCQKIITPHSSELFAKCGRERFSWKTHPSLFTEECTEFCGTWPKWGSMEDGACSELVTPAFPISGCAGGVNLPTPSGVNGGKNHTMGRIDEWGGSSNPLRGTALGCLCSPEFEEMAMGWPIGWTALTPLGMDRFQQWLDLHGKPCPNE
jgi:hypothetical protein